jgi:hypothetical protein
MMVVIYIKIHRHKYTIIMLVSLELHEQLLPLTENLYSRETKKYYTKNIL